MILFNLATPKLAGKHDWISSTQKETGGVSLLHGNEPGAFYKLLPTFERAYEGDLSQRDREANINVRSQSKHLALVEIARFGYF